jgi:hypothetical protein
MTAARRLLPMLLDCAVSRGASSPRPVRVLESAGAKAKWLAPSQPPPTRLQQTT